MKDLNKFVNIINHQLLMAFKGEKETWGIRKSYKDFHIGECKNPSLSLSRYVKGELRNVYIVTLEDLAERNCTKVHMYERYRSNNHFYFKSDCEGTISDELTEYTYWDFLDIAEEVRNINHAYEFQFDMMTGEIMDVGLEKFLEDSSINNDYLHEITEDCAGSLTFSEFVNRMYGLENCGKSLLKWLSKNGSRKLLPKEKIQFMLNHIKDDASDEKILICEGYDEKWDKK